MNQFKPLPSKKNSAICTSGDAQDIIIKHLLYSESTILSMFYVRLFVLNFNLVKSIQKDELRATDMDYNQQKQSFSFHGTVKFKLACEGCSLLKSDNTFAGPFRYRAL